ncbi:hypothetical protein ACFVY1_44330 [Streptomyces sp. NPDC058293]|uniref:hypothetical protein n=1 Tax=Streptomyces sp. NPDC058293 TaxID=3346429 RepID=UPI0036F02356
MVSRPATGPAAISRPQLAHSTRGSFITCPVWPHWHGGIGYQTPRAEGGEHPLGRACDYTPGALGTRASDTALAQGWALAAWLRKNAGALDVQYVIWQGRIWSINHPQDQGGWGRPYDHGLNNPHTVTGGHYDHVHVTTRTERRVVRSPPAPHIPVGPTS